MQNKEKYNNQRYYMEQAILEAKKAYKKDEVPVGAIIVKDGKILACKHNTVEKNQNAMHHAEILAINEASKKIKSWRLNDATMYVTLMPCKMCIGAIENSRISEVIYLCEKPDNLNYSNKYINKKDIFKKYINNNQENEIYNEYIEMLKEFFKEIRNEKK